MMLNNALKTLLAAGALLPALSNATAVAYSDATAWAASADAESTVDFDLPGATGYVERGNEYTEGDVTFTTANGIFSVYDVSYDPAYHTSGYLDVEGSTIGMSFASGVTAFSFDFGAFYDSTVSLTITLSDGSVFTANAGSLQYGFFGVVSDEPITCLWITTDYPYTTFDNVVLGAAVSSVPEPASPLLFGLGVLGLLAVRRRAER